LHWARQQRIQRYYYPCYPFNGLQINLDYQTIEESLEEACEPHAGGCWMSCLSLYDPDNRVARFREAFGNVTCDECDQAFVAVMQDELSTYIGKIRTPSGYGLDRVLPCLPA